MARLIVRHAMIDDVEEAIRAEGIAQLVHKLSASLRSRIFGEVEDGEVCKINYSRCKVSGIIKINEYSRYS